ncbi:unnamed protein product [Rotaria sp. Silwood1]|nr:unnamed protein product [Rotaria sp. Silwood1]
MAKDRMKDLKNSIPKSDASYQQLPQVQNHNTLNIVDDCGIPLTSIDIDKEHKVSEFLDRINSLRERIDEIKVLTRDVKKIYERMRQPEPDPELEQKLVGKNAEIKKLRDDIRTELQKLKQEYQFQDETQESAEWRIATVQILNKIKEFHEIMNQYNQEYCTHRDKCEKAVLHELQITTLPQRRSAVSNNVENEFIIILLNDGTPTTISINSCSLFVNEYGAININGKFFKYFDFFLLIIFVDDDTKRNNPNDEIIKSMSTGQATIEELISVLVTEANEAEDDEHKTSEQLRLLMRKHYTVGGLADVLSVFGPVKDDFITLGKIAKSRAVTIFRDLKSGAGSTGPSSTMKPPDSHIDTSAHIVSPSKPSEMPSSNPASSFYNQTTSNKDVPLDVISQSQKLLRYANSALEHEDIATAVYNCEQALQLLQPYNH